MIDIYVYIFIVSFCFQVYYGVKFYKSLFNPITLINIIFFLHNWSYSFLEVLHAKALEFYPYILSPGSQAFVLSANLIGLWVCFFCIIISSIVTKERKSKNFTYDLKIFKILYFIFYIFSIIDGVVFGKFQGVYGANQALIADEAFSPLGQLLNARVIFAAITILDISKTTKKTSILILVLELVFSLLFGGRKALIIVVLSFIFSRITFKAKYIAPLLLIFISLMFLNIYLSQYRALKNTNGTFLDKNKAILFNLNEFNPLDLFALGIISTNSEYVQGWVYNEMQKNDHMYGKTYIQAAVNTIVPRPFQGEMVHWQAAYTFKQMAYRNERNMGYDFTFTAEALMNFGNFSFISFGILGMFLGMTYKRGKDSQFWNYLYIISWPILLICFRTDSTSMFRWYSYFVLTFWFLEKIKLIKRYER